MRRFDNVRQRVTNFTKKQIKLKDTMNKPFNIGIVLLTGIIA